MLEDMDSYYNSNNEVDVVVMSGDFVVHGLASHDPTKTNWDTMKETIKAATDRVKDKLPKAYIIPCVGNNDVENHY